jgi:predicted metal-dependent hydrolase
VPELRLTHETLTYEIDRRRRRTVGVVVRPDGRVEVHAPLATPSAEVRRIVERFRPWIEKKREEAKERQRRRRLRSFDDGDLVPYLGGTLRLVVAERDRAALGSVAREGEELRVPVPTGLDAPSRRAVVRYAVLRWMLEEARRIFHERHKVAAERVGRSAKRVVIKDMASRWGSCGPDRNMSLNWRLILAPERILDYVLVHELCHIDVPNHSKAFWDRVAKHCDTWRDSRRWLRKHGEELDL